MARGRGTLLRDQLQTHPQCHELRSQPRQHLPNGHRMQGSFIDLRGGSSRLITDHSLRGSGRLTVRLSVMLQIAVRKFQQRWASVTLIWEYESRDSR